MQRRQFLAASIATSAAVLARNVDAQTPTPASHPREFYQLRRYSMQTGPQISLTEHYIAEALIPALNRRGMSPVGAFRLDVGPETPTFYVLIPSQSPGIAATLELDLAQDADYVKAADAFWNSPATAPAFLRVESTLLAAFQGWPRMTQPFADPHGKRVFQLRTYESPSYRDHVRKVEMFHSGEFEIFKAAGFRPVFFADTLVGQRMPSLTYMLGFNDLTELTTQWSTFSSDPAWKKLSADPRFAYEQIVSNITNLYLSPLSSSQI